MTRLLTLLILTVTLVQAAASVRRVTMSLDGACEIEESSSATGIPKAFGQRGPVPGLTNLAQPAFADVDLFDSRELIRNQIGKGVRPASERTKAVGVARQNRNYFWYRTTFRPAAKRSVAILRIGKAQFGTAHFKQPEAPHPSAHASILNEYGWLWLTRDGSPTVLTKRQWESLLGPNATGAERLKEWAYLPGGLTEYWRSTRYHAGILHFVYLTGSYPGVFTSDHWRDVEKLELDPDFADYGGEAFKPLGVYVNFWQPQLKQGVERRIPVSLINDDAELAGGRLVLTLEAGARELVRQEQPFSVSGLGQQSYEFKLKTPDAAAGSAMLRVTAYPDGSRHKSPTVCRRKTEVAK